MSEQQENLYGDKAIIGSKEDATQALDGRDVQIKTSNTQTVTLKPEEETQHTNNDPADETQETDQEQDQTPEQKLEKDIKAQMQAEQDAKKDLEAKGIQWDHLAQEYEATGTLSASSLADLEKAGYPRSVVDAYVKGMEATALQFENQVMEYAGGKEHFQQITGFIKSLGTPYINAFNTAIQSGDLTQIRVTLEGFKAQMAQKYGTNNRTILGKGYAQTGIKGFESKDEMTKAMSDKRYGRDPKYTKEIETKTARSKFL